MASVYPQEILMMAPAVPCPHCGGPTTASIERKKGAPPRWAYTCRPCVNAYSDSYHGSHALVKRPSGRFSRKMEPATLTTVKHALDAMEANS